MFSFVFLFAICMPLIIAILIIVVLCLLCLFVLFVFLLFLFCICMPPAEFVRQRPEQDHQRDPELGGDSCIEGRVFLPPME